MKITKNDFCYCAGIIMMLIRTYINNTVLSEIFVMYDVVLIPVIFILFFCKFLNNKYSKKELIIILLFLILSIYTSLKTGKYVVLMSCLALVSIKNVNVIKVIKVIFITNVFFLSTIIVSYLAEVLINPQNINMNFFYKGEIRHTFYFNHPNMIANVFFWTLAEYMFLSKEKKSILVYLIVLFLGMFIVEMTKTRTTMICVLLLIVFNLPILNKDRFYDFCKYFSKNGFWILSIIFIFLVSNYQWFYENCFSLIDKIDAVLSRRLSLPHMIMNEYGFSLFPQNVDYNKVFCWGNIYSLTLIIDNVFLQCALIYGLIYNGILSIIFFYGSVNFCNKKYYIYTVIALITGIVENYIMNVGIVFPMLLLVNEIYVQKEKKSEK